MMARRMMRKHHVRCRAGEKVEITSKPYLSLFQFCCREITSRYALPIIISENGLGAFDKLEEDGAVHDVYRVEYLKEHLKALGEAIEEGCEVLAYCTWSFTDLLSWLNGYQKRYGFVYVDRNEEGGTLNRYKKDSYYWYKDVISTNGENLYK